jgi:hypothetical protein
MRRAHRAHNRDVANVQLTDAMKNGEACARVLLRERAYDGVHEAFGHGNVRLVIEARDTLAVVFVADNANKKGHGSCA